MFADRVVPADSALPPEIDRDVLAAELPETDVQNPVSAIVARALRNIGGVAVGRDPDKASCFPGLRREPG